MGRMLGEGVRRGYRRAAALVAGGILLSACSYQMEHEPIDFLNPVGPMTPVATAPAPPSIVPGPSPEVNMGKSTNMVVCLGAFVDKLHKKVTVLPVSSTPPDSQSPFPMRVEFREGGGSGIYPEPAPYAAQDFMWYDLAGKDLGTTPPTCEERPVRIAKISLPHVNRPDLALVGPPDVVEANSIYSRQFSYGTQDDLRAIARDLQATI
jgi:hypothetical protein